VSRAKLILVNMFIKMVSEISHSLPYVSLVGGVFAISVDQFLQVNGYSNLFWGWGAEDDDMYHR
jgi:beta-1,4-galactosyltransferase 1